MSVDQGHRALTWGFAPPVGLEPTTLRTTAAGRGWTRVTASDLVRPFPWTRVDAVGRGRPQGFWTGKVSADLGRVLTRITDRLADVPGWAWFTLTAPLLTVAHIWAGVVGQLLVHWIYTDLSRPNAAFYAGCGWLAASLATWGVSVLRVAEWTGVVRRIASAGTAVAR